MNAEQSKKKNEEKLSSSYGHILWVTFDWGDYSVRKERCRLAGVCIEVEKYQKRELHPAINHFFMITILYHHHHDDRRGCTAVWLSHEFNRDILLWGIWDLYKGKEEKQSSNFSARRRRHCSWKTINVIKQLRSASSHCMNPYWRSFRKKKERIIK